MFKVACILITIFVFLSCKNEVKKAETNDSVTVHIDSTNITKSDTLTKVTAANKEYFNLMKKHIHLCDIDTACNFKRAYFFIDKVVTDKENLQSLTASIVDSVFEKMVFNHDCKTARRCGVYIFYSKYDCKINTWVAMGTKFANGIDNTESVEISDEVLKKYLSTANH